MASRRVESLLCKDPSTWIQKNVGIVDGLLSAFQQIVPALQQLRTPLNFDKDVVVKQQYMKLCRRLRNCAEQTLAFIDRLSGVLSLRRDEPRRARIFTEFQAIAISDSSVYSLESSSTAIPDSGYRKMCPQLYDLEDELRVRLEGLKKAQDALNELCGQIDQDILDVVQAGHSSRSEVMVWSVWLTRNAAFGALTFGALVFALGISGVSPFYNKWLFGVLNIPFGIAYLACLGVCCKCLSAKYAQLNNGTVSVNEAIITLRSISSEMACSTGGNTGALARKAVLIPEIRVAMESFFSDKKEEIHIKHCKTEIEQVISILYQYN